MPPTNNLIQLTLMDEGWLELTYSVNPNGRGGGGVGISLLC